MNMRWHFVTTDRGPHADAFVARSQSIGNSGSILTTARLAARTRSMIFALAPMPGAHEIHLAKGHSLAFS